MRARSGTPRGRASRRAHARRARGAPTPRRGSARTGRRPRRSRCWTPGEPRRRDDPAVSFWWDSIGGLRRTRDPLDAGLECDVAIVGGGYTGLWAALELRRADPSLDVVVLEREACGFGASGRNGGWLLGELARPFSPA